MTDPLAPLLAQLHLAQAAAVLPAWLERAAEQELSYTDFLQGLLEEECIARTNTATARRLQDAGFPFARHDRTVRFPLPTRPQAAGGLALSRPHLRRPSDHGDPDWPAGPGENM